jgi:hypothetical protein
MCALRTGPAPLRACPFCGVASDVNHETQEGCIAALQSEIARMRSILSHLKPAGVPQADEQESPRTARLALE